MLGTIIQLKTNYSHKNTLIHKKTVGFTCTPDTHLDSPAD